MVTSLAGYSWATLTDGMTAGISVALSSRTLNSVFMSFTFIRGTRPGTRSREQHDGGRAPITWQALAGLPGGRLLSNQRKRVTSIQPLCSQESGHFIRNCEVIQVGEWKVSIAVYAYVGQANKGDIAAMAVDGLGP